MLLQWVCYSVTHKKRPMWPYQTPACASCMTVKAELVYSHVLKMLDSDLRPFSPLICQLTAHSHQDPWGFTLDAFISLSLFAVSLSLVISLSHSMHLLIFPSSPTLPPLIYQLFTPIPPPSAKFPVTPSFRFCSLSFLCHSFPITRSVHVLVLSHPA